MPGTILVHGRCADGLTSAGLLRRRLADATVHYVQPADLRPTLETLDATKGPFVLADLSPQTADTDAILGALRRLANAGKVTWIDHHAPQWSASFEKQVRALGVEVVLDRTETESGASLSARWTGEKDRGLLRVADLIRRRDAWVEPHNPDARAWTLLATELSEAYVDRLARADLAGLEEQGHALLDAKEKSIARSLAAVRRPTERVAVLWSEDDISDVADRLFQADPKVVFLLRFGPSRRVSIRSRPDRPVAAALAQAHGGGGHANAAGFTLRLGWFQRVLFRVRGANHGAPRAVVAAADRLAASPKD